MVSIFICHQPNVCVQGSTLGSTFVKCAVSKISILHHVHPTPTPTEGIWNFLGMGGLLGSSISHCTVWGRECRPGSKKQFKSSLEVCKTKIFKEMYETLFGTCREVEILKQNSFCGPGGGMDIIWNYTVLLMFILSA